MVDPLTTRLWLMRALYVVLGLLVIFFHLLPLSVSPSRWIGPDLVVALTFAWAMRRPEYVPALSIGIVAFLADLLLQRPPGLMAALVVAGAETLRASARSNRDLHFFIEWATVAGVIVAIALAHRITLSALFVPTASVGLGILQSVLTIAIYPVVVLVSHVFFRVSKPAPGEVDALGHRL